jgi:hypothetical protein
MIEQSNVKDSEQKALLASCFHVGFLLGLLFVPEDGGYVSSKHYAPKIGLFITTAVRTSSYTEAV